MYKYEPEPFIASVEIKMDWDWDNIYMEIIEIEEFITEEEMMLC